MEEPKETYPLDEKIAESTELADLVRVGKEKPLGYLPCETIREYAGIEPEQVNDYLQRHGLSTRVFNDLELLKKNHTEEELQRLKPEDFLYVYDKKALHTLLEQNATTLEQNNWPLDPDGFVRDVFMRREPIGTPVYKLIAEAFGDEFSKNLEEETTNS